MQDDLTSKIPLRENIKNIKNLVSYTYKIDRSMYYLPVIQILMNAIKGAVSLVLSANILEMLYEKKPMEEIMWQVAMLLGLTFFINILNSILQNQFIGPGRANVRRIYDGNLAAKYQYMDYSLVDSPFVRNLRRRIYKDNNWGSGLSNLFWDYDAIVSGVCRLICSLIVAFPILKIIVRSHNLWIYAGIVAMIIVLFILTKIVAKADAKYNQELLSDYWDGISMEDFKEYANFGWDWINHCISGDYHFIKDVHLYDGFDLMEKYTTENMKEGEKLTGRIAKVAKLSGRLGLFQSMTGSFMKLSGYLISARFALAGAFPVGSVIKFAGSITNVIIGFQGMGERYNRISLTARKHASTMEMLSISDEMYKGKLPVEKRMDNKYEVEFCNVSFKYPGAEQYALKNFSLKLRIGERMAIVGMNGSGKTTMIKLLCRLYDPEEGEILLNGVDIRKFDQKEYIKLFSVVFQDFQLLSMPLGQNVACAINVDEDLAVKTLSQAGLAERLTQLPDGLDTFLYQDIKDDGVEISGGEAQKISIARALYKDAPFVLLDEPTASLDPLSEYEIYSRFDTMVKDKTAIYISHRLSSCRFCDDIAVLHDGRLVQRGSHEELLKDETGKYYELWNAQAQYYT